VGALTSQQPYGLPGPVTGIAVPFLPLWFKRIELGKLLERISEICPEIV
jgi:putative effector of murein hydrolase LrgA (UPF0299 family)